MRKCVFFWIVLLGTVFAPAFLEGAARYYRYSDDKQLYYTRDGRIYRYSDDKQLFYMRDKRIYRYSDDKQLYYIRDNRIYRYSDDKQILYYRGEDFKLTVFMVLMLVDM